ncbi:MAG: cysteine--tRNA ligase [Candidatus Pacebacteria bacterium]|nr:cysteine--tRNA ligase [Candidatus Paceibacterota bacterium]
MQKLSLHNTLSRKKEEFKPIIDGEVGLYTCGPTVYNFAHLGNLRTYLFEDFLKRSLFFAGYKVKHVMNITDVGHLVGDGDMGEDKLEKRSKIEKKSAWEIADFYLEAFKLDLSHLNIIFPSNWYKATETISEQIKLIEELELKGYAYRISDGIYFDTSKFKDYTKLSHQKIEDLQEGARVEKNQEKRNPTDFALWKFSPENEKRQMEWESPWGLGFPGWHIECSAMSLKGLGKQLDIHCGGVDHVNIHHTNEIAQSEAATGEKFFNYWLHGAFLIVSGGKKMAKSKDNFLTLKNALIDKNLHSLAFRLACLQAHYRKPLEYSEDMLQASNNALLAIYDKVNFLGREVAEVDNNYLQEFKSLVFDDLNLPQALAVFHKLLKDESVKKAVKLATALEMDKVLGLNLKSVIENEEDIEIPDEIEKLAKARQLSREQKDFKEADLIREEIEAKGYIIEESQQGFVIKKKR